MTEFIQISDLELIYKENILFKLLCRFEYNKIINFINESTNEELNRILRLIIFNISYINYDLDNIDEYWKTISLLYQYPENLFRNNNNLFIIIYDPMDVTVKYAIGITKNVDDDLLHWYTTLQILL